MTPEKFTLKRIATPAECEVRKLTNDLPFHSLQVSKKVS
jgi:hypothetical protein